MVGILTFFASFIFCLMERGSTCTVYFKQNFRNEVLQITEGIEDLGVLRWELLICLAVAWTVIFLCLCKGVKSSGRVSPRLPVMSFLESLDLFMEVC